VHRLVLLQRRALPLRAAPQLRELALARAAPLPELALALLHAAHGGGLVALHLCDVVLQLLHHLLHARLWEGRGRAGGGEGG
jgi:hypothetical protein